jgi:hypothetical protein
LKRPFIRQILSSSLYYFIGFFIVWLVYKLSGTPYAHGPNLFHLVGLLVLLGGIVWLIKAIASQFTKDKQVGALLIHTLVIGGFVTAFIFEISKESDIGITDPESILTINKDTSTNSASIVNGNGDTILIDKVGTDTSKQK